MVVMKNDLSSIRLCDLLIIGCFPPWRRFSALSLFIRQPQGWKSTSDGLGWLCSFYNDDFSASDGISRDFRAGASVVNRGSH
jgi:hypothetical protein